MGPPPLATNDISAKACLTETIQLVPDEKQHCFSNVAPKSMSYSYVVHQYHFYLYVIYQVVHNYVVHYCLEWFFVLLGEKIFGLFA